MFDRTIVAKYRDDIVRDLSACIRIPSVNGPAESGAPFGKPAAEALRFVLECGVRLGFTTRNIDGYAGHVEYGTRGPLYGVLAHLDVVPPGDGWTREPFGGLVEDDLIYGRGAADNKGPAITSLYVLKAFADQIPDPPARIRCIFGTNEESGMAGVKHYFEHEELPVFGFSPDSRYPLFNREMGIVNAHLEAPRNGTHIVRRLSGGEALNMVANEARAEILPAWEQPVMQAIDEIDTQASMEHRIEARREDGVLIVSAKGISAHGGRPANGVSAIAYLVRVLYEAIRIIESSNSNRTGSPVEPEIAALASILGFETRGDSLGVACRDKESGELSVNWGTIEVDETSVKSGLNIRYPVTAEFGEISDALTKRVGRYGFAVEFEHHLEPLFIPEDDPYIRTLMNAYNYVTGDTGSPLWMAGGTYARMLKNRGVAFGAGFAGEDNNVHQPDEHVSIDSLMRHAEISLQAIHDLVFRSEA